ncbi:MAG: hypothetical protein AMXMBFR64_05630 [Myxococcales bacterium]
MNLRAVLGVLLAVTASCTELASDQGALDAAVAPESPGFSGTYHAPTDTPEGPPAGAPDVALGAAFADAGVVLADDAGIGAQDGGGAGDAHADSGPGGHPPLDAVVAPADVGPGAPVAPPAGTGGSGGPSGLSAGACGPRAYTAYVPATAATPTPVVIATHGYGDDHANFANTLLVSGWKQAADAHGFILFSPASLHPSQPTFLYLTAGGLDWPSTRGEIEGVLGCVYDGLGAKYDVDTAGIYWIGFSEGGVVADLAAWHLSKELRAVAPYAGGVKGKPLPAARKIPVYFICGTQDSGYAEITGVLGEWQAAGHPTNAAWVPGVGHKLSALCQSPSPSAVWEWLSTVPAEPVTPSLGGGPTGPGEPPVGSGGAGGAYPGPQERTVTVPGLGAHTYWLQVPASYAPGTGAPLLLALHGAGGAGTAQKAAAATRDAWAPVAEAGGFIVVAQAATGASGGWVPSTDVAVLNAVLEDVTAAYDVDVSRIYGWGFSAGGHFMHALGLQNAELFAGYGVSAGSLSALAGQGAPAAASRVIPVDIHIGTADPLYAAVSQDPGAFQMAGWTLGSTLQYTTFAGGHTFEPAHLVEIWANIQ